MKTYVQSTMRRARKALASTRARLSLSANTFSERKRRYLAIASIKFAWLRYGWQKVGFRYKSFIRIFLLAVAISFSVWGSERLQAALVPYFPSDGARTTALWNLLVQLGSALTAVMAIAFSVIVFAQQINVGRMPHGLFWRFTTDAKIMWAFAGVFALAIGVTFTGLIQDAAYVALALIIASWCMLLIFLLTVYAFRRSLLLISPVKQLSIVLADVTKELKLWGRRAERARPLLEANDAGARPKSSTKEHAVDAPRVRYFHLNQHWTDSAGRGVEYAIAFARRFAEQGDSQVSSFALSVVVEINAQYIKAKGRTFFSTNFLVDNPLATDGFINSSLEQLRQAVSVAIARRDEQQAGQLLTALRRLVAVYLEIDYSDPVASKFHSHLASTYLSDAVQLTVQNRLTDLAMEGIRLLGQCGLLFLKSGDPDDLPALCQKIGIMGATGIADERTRPMTLTAVAEISDLTFALLHLDHRHNIRFATKELAGDISFIAKLLLQIPDTPLMSVHSSNLAPYYSVTSTTGFLRKLTDLVNAVVEAKKDNEAARNAVRKFEEWSEEAHQPVRELFKLSIEKRSKFTFDLIYWIAHVSKLLLAIARAPACDDHNRDELEKHALWLVSTLSFVNDDKESVAHVELYNLGEKLFEAAMDAHARAFNEFAQAVGDLLVDWGLKAGRHKSGWATLERALWGAATLATRLDGLECVARYKKRIAEHLQRLGSIDQEELDDVAKRLRRLAQHGPDRNEFTFSRIQRVMAQTDEDSLAHALNELADALSPPSGH